MTFSERVSKMIEIIKDSRLALIAKGETVPYDDDIPDVIEQMSGGATLSETYDITEGTLTTTTVTLNGDLTATIPDGVVTIGENAFYLNNIITKVVMPETVMAIAGGMWNGAFTACRLLKSIELSSNLQSIGEYAFSQTGFEELTLPQGLQSIGFHCFSRCENLKRLNVPDSVTDLGEGFLINCDSLKTFVFPNAITKIPTNTFYQCDNIENVVIPSTVTEIEYGAFNISVSTLDIYFKGTQAQWESITVGNNNGALSTATIHYEYSGDGSELFEGN